MVALTFTSFSVHAFDASAESYIKEKETVEVGASAVSAKSAILIRSDGTVLFEKNADERLPMASTTKIMTAVIVLENMSLDTEVTVADESIGIEGSSMYLQKGETLTIRDLLYALMLQSANDAAVALAFAVSGGIDGFTELMNEKAEDLGLKDTHFTNPSGLDDEEHFTTAHELALIAGYALENKDFRTIVSTLKYTYTTSLKSGVFVNHNRLLYSMPGCIGVKTGYTQRSGRCLVSASSNDGLEIICVTIDDPNDWKEHKALHAYAVSQYEKYEVIGDGFLTYELPVINGKSQKIMCACTDGEEFWSEKDGEVGYVIELPNFLYAPVSAGEICGRVVIMNNGVETGSVDIVTLEGTDGIVYRRFIDKIYDFIRGLFK